MEVGYIMRLDGAKALLDARVEAHVVALKSLGSATLRHTRHMVAHKRVRPTVFPLLSSLASARIISRRFRKK